ncbi:STAS domain-containing protein [Streptomyces sp. 378]|uniref:STAS domain-containing protein n=1 Tax=Streptomyces sp. 378 TaxID=3049412 RepID=UPI0024C3F702|nr:STAS domain-containing protein [Streptomyces sp. 378]MDK1344667.1 STAS domain-containing protein [Streptomyces sp. 378]
MADISSRSVLPQPPERRADVVTLTGEIDLATAQALRTRLDVLTGGTDLDLVLDLRPVSFIDCAGLGVLCRVRNRVLARRGRLRLVSGSPSLLRVLRLAGLAGDFEVLPVMPEALAHTLPESTAIR